jgi:hypothetical protein
MAKRASSGGPRNLPVVGWREWVSLPGLGIPRIQAKIDTGARSSSIHARELGRFVREGRSFVRLEVRPLRRDGASAVVAEAELLDDRSVRSSSGHKEVRPVILTEVELAGRRFPIEITLAGREAMGFRMLLGREAVRGRFLVDAGRSYLGPPGGEGPGRDTARGGGRGR